MHLITEERSLVIRTTTAARISRRLRDQYEMELNGLDSCLQAKRDEEEIPWRPVVIAVRSERTSLLILK